MPETLHGLWNQRLRWAKGGAQVVRRHAMDLMCWRRRRMWPVLLETMVSATWAFSLLVLLALALAGALVSVPAWAYVDMTGPSWHSVVLASVCMTSSRSAS